jgi:hypothetical protein
LRRYVLSPAGQIAAERARLDLERPRH